jgi:hypothetical protein
MPPRLRGKWALGITPRNFTWILKDKLAICERPGGVGDSHRRVRRQEEIIWLRENGFGCVLSIIAAPHNLHNYEELQMPYRHRPFNAEHTDQYLKALYGEIRDLLRHNTKVLVHGDELGDRIIGIMGGYIRWAGLVEDPTKAIQVTERIAGRQLDPFARAANVECPGIRLAARPTERVNRFADVDIGEAEFVQHPRPACTRQASGNSTGPQVDLSERLLGDGSAVGDVGELQDSARP